MDVCSTLISVIVGILSLVLLYVLFMSRHYLVFKRLGVRHLTPWPGIGSVPDITKHGLMEFHRKTYKQFANEKGQALTFIVAGYDTASIVMSFSMFLLAHNPDVLRKLQEELDRELEGKLPNYDNINSLVYLEMVMNETMRMYPPAQVIDRVCSQDCVIQGVQIKKGVTVQFPFLAIFKDPTIFPDPEKFDPERFSPENKASRHPFAFLPFGQGPRNCIGMRLALMEMKIAMAAVMQEMSPVPCSKSVNPPRLKQYFQMQALDGLWAKFVPREEE